MFYRDVRAGGVPGCGVTESGRATGACCLTLSPGVAGVLPAGVVPRTPPVAALSARTVAESTGTIPVICLFVTSWYAGRIDGQKS